MRVLIVANHNKGYFAPFIIEQVEALERLGVEFDFFGIHGKGISGYLSNLTSLRKKIHEYRPDLIHAHYGLSGFLANLQRGVPVITTYHGSDIHSKGMNLKISKSTAYFSAYNIFVSKWLMDLSGFKGAEKSVIPCGVDTKTFAPMERDDARRMLGWGIDDEYVLFAGAFDSEVKNSPLAKAATALIPRAQLIELRGYSREQVNLAMNAANCLLMTSLREGSPQVVKEAMLCGTPIVSVDVGDVKTITADTDGCYLTSYDVQDVASGIRKALNFHGKTKGEKRIKELYLSNDFISKKILDVYNHVLKMQ